MKKLITTNIIIISIYLLVISNVYANNTFKIFKAGAGENTKIIANQVSKDNKDNYSNYGIALEIGKKFEHFNLSIEPSIYNHRVSDNYFNEKFITTGCLVWLSKDIFKYVRLGIAGGFGTFLRNKNRDSSNYLGTSGLTGEMGGKMKDMCDYLINVPSNDTPRIQEVHILIGHIICEMIELNIFPK